MLHYEKPSEGEFHILLPASKSVSNRVIVLQSLAGGNFADLQNLSEAADTQVLIKAITQFNNGDKELNIGHAGTAMRFLTAYLALKRFEGVLTGSERMLERPIGPLIEVLQNLGFDLDAGIGGFPPVTFRGIRESGANSVSIAGNISSQFITALMLIAPYLPNGLKINLTTALTSRPYVLQTAQVMERFGVVASVNEQEITIPKGTYKPQQLTIEPDWSAFGYVASCILLTNLYCEIPYLQPSTLQGDFGIVPFFQQLGLEVEFLENSSKLTKKPNFILPRELEIDFTEMPDQAQTLVVLCAALGVGLKANGLHTLRHKETDRIVALQNELAKFNISFSENAQGTFELEGKIEPWQGTISLETYEDHRMAMAFAPLAAFGSLDFDEPSVVKKSFPHFWTELNKLGYRYI